ncbi:MAG TPA: nicotinate-nicotinamide nucleotide adenylyltransferase [bacterium]|nr:nicotinate-nicotinamide nucleotide adenylyltransferase [bacterium]
MIFGAKKARKRVGVFGGSFNPPHIGHSAICRWLFEHGLVDMLWVVPCYIHPFGKKLAPFADRLSMCRMAFSKLALPIDVLDVEREIGGTSYTLLTIKHLMAKHPELRFLLVTGEDVSGESDKWQDFGKIRELVEIIRVPRGPDSPVPDVSSTQVRELIESRKPVSGLVEDEVAIYLVTKALYRQDS